MHLARLILVTALAAAAHPVLAGSASAGELSNPWTIVFDTACDLDGDGSLETSFRVATLLNGTSTGRVLGTTSQANVLAGDATIVSAGGVKQVHFPERPGVGLDAVPCEAAGTYVDADGDVVQIVIVNLLLQITPESER